MTQPTGVRLRAARPADIEAIRDIERRAAVRMRQTPYSEIADAEPTDAATLAARVAAGGLMAACGDDDAPVAQVMFRPLGGDWYVEQLDVLPEYAGRRIGAALLDAVAARARAAGAAALVLSTFRDVPFNAPYYRRLGFIDLDDAALTQDLLAIRAEHVARGLDESRRVFMRRSV